jgi:hypothetical protein
MLYFLGGTPRSGKSILAREISRRTGVPTVSTDLLRGVLMQVVPDLRDAMSVGDPVREADVFSPHLMQTALVAEIQLENCLIEGVGFLPRQLPRLAEMVGSDIRACFLGRSSSTVDDLFGHPSDHRDYERLSSEERDAFPEHLARWTKLVADDCEKWGFPFVDLAMKGFVGGLRVADAHLMGGDDAGAPRDAPGPASSS